MTHLQSNLMQAGEAIACGHCEPDKGFELVEKYGLSCECKCHKKNNLQSMIDRFDELFYRMDAYGLYGKDGGSPIYSTEFTPFDAIKDFINQEINTAITQERKEHKAELIEIKWEIGKLLEGFEDTNFEPQHKEYNEGFNKSLKYIVSILDNHITNLQSKSE